MVHEVALKPRGRRPDVLVLEGMEPVAVIEAKDRRRLGKPDVVGVIKEYKKYKPGSDFRLLIYVPVGCDVSQPALDHATANRIDIVRIPFTLNRKRRPAVGQRRAKVILRFRRNGRPSRSSPGSRIVALAGARWASCA